MVGRLSRFFGVLVLAALYWFPVRRRYGRWGTTPEEWQSTMPGDSLISDPTDVSMQAVTIEAPPGDVWPWLAQLGYQRGGMYSYDWLDRLFGFLDRPSATRVIPELQHPVVGERVPWGRPFGSSQELTLSVLDPPRALAFSYEDNGMEWVWQFCLYPLDGGGTRLVTRGTERVANTPLAWLGMRIMEPAAFIMTRRMMLGVKARAEALHAGARDGRAAERHAAPAPTQ